MSAAGARRIAPPTGPAHSGRMDLQQLAKCLEKLGNPRRLEIFRQLVRAGPEGLPVGRIQDQLGVPASTLSHHLFHLVSVDLVRQEREGRVLRCRANFELMDAVVASLTAECCADAPSGRRADPALRDRAR